MSFGDHLEELRSCLIKSIVGFVLGAIICLYFSKSILLLIYQPVLVVQHAAGLRPWLQALSPTAPFLAYIKIAFLAGLIVSMPWILYQAWSFVASGLYAHEKRFVRLLLPASFGLFALGVLFLYYVVLPIVLQFLVMFNATFPLPDLEPRGLQRLIVADTPVTDAEPSAPAAIPGSLPMLDEDPPDPAIGQFWIHRPTSQLRVHTPEGDRFVPLEKVSASSAVHSQFAIDYYVSFVLLLALAFGIAFELPIVVFFLAWSGIVSTTEMRRSRRYVLLGIVIAAAVLTPPDVISQILLAGPMYLLFELGLLVGGTVEKRAA